MHTRKVNTYGRRSIAIVPASANFGRPLLTPPRAMRPTSPSPGSPLSEISAGLVVVSPSLPRSPPSSVLTKRSKKVSSKNLPKKENLVADMSALSISSPPVAKPRKRKPLLVPSPKVRGSPKQSRMRKKVPSLAKPGPRHAPAPLQTADNVVSKPSKPQTDRSVIEISDDSFVAPNKPPSGRSTNNQVVRAAPNVLPTRAPSESIIVISDDSLELGAHPAREPSNARRPSLQPLSRQDAIVGTPPLLRLSSSKRLSAGAIPRLSFGSVVNVSPPHQPAPPINLDDNLPSPVDSEDEVAFLDVLAELESKPAPSPPPAARTHSEPGPALRAQPQPLASSSRSFGAPSALANVEPKAADPMPRAPRTKPRPNSTKSLPLVPTRSRPSIVYVEIPVPKKSSGSGSRPDSAKEPATTQPLSITAEPPKPPKSTKPLEPQAKTKKQREPAPSISKPIPPSESGSSKPKPVKPATKARPLPEPAISSHARQLRSLLSVYSQPEPLDLDAFVATFSTDDVHMRYPAPPSASVSRRRWRKIGEASYSEVFGLGGVVVKIVPLKMEDGWKDVEEGPCVSEMADVEKEIAVTMAMGEMQDGFIKLAKAHVARGRYPQELLDLWDAWDREIGSESIRPNFTSSQLYVLLILPDGGPDLEHYTFAPRTSWRAAAGIFWQVTRTLARAESLVRFEHRDLHWGQILIQNIQPAKHTKSKSNTKAKAHAGTMDSPEHCGVRVTLIDLGLSRMDTHTRSAWFTEPEPEIFEGEGDYQFDVYRMMKAHCAGIETAWEKFKPLTNVMWLHYLARQLLTAKGLRKPDTVTSRYHTADDVQAEIQAFSCLIEVEKTLAGAISKVGGATVAKEGGSVLKKAAKGVSGSSVQKLVDAQSVVRWGAERRWVNPACGSIDEGRGVL